MEVALVDAEVGFTWSDADWANRNYWRIYQVVYREERELMERGMIDIGGES